MNIRTKLSLVIVCCIVLACLAVGVISSLLMERYLSKYVLRRLEDTAKFISARTSDFMKQREKDIDRLAGNKTLYLFFNNSDKADKQQLHDLFIPYANNYNELRLVDKTGKVIVKLVNGKIVLENLGRYYSSNFNKILESSKVNIESAGTNGVTELQQINIIKPVLNNGQAVGAIVGTVNYVDFYNMLKSNFVDSGYLLQIVDIKTNNVLCGFWGAWPKDCFKAYSKIKNTKWVVEVALSRKFFNRNLYTTKLLTFLVTCSVIFVGIIIALIISRQFSKPLEMMSAATRSIAKGNLSINIEHNSRDEFGRLAGSFNQMAKQLDKSKKEMEAMHKQTIHMLAKASEYKDFQAHKHIDRVTKMTVELALEMGLNKEDANQVGLDSILYEFGKLGVPDNILLKPDRLNIDEFETVKQHTVIGAEILGESEWLKQAKQIALSHHERWDGTGYPQGLKEEEIPLGARIVAVADVFDVLISKKTYKKPWKLEEAVEEIKQKSGKQFDPTVVKAFLSLYNKGSLKKFIPKNSNDNSKYNI